MKLIVGLGNPGTQYERTRHNAGFFALDRVIARHGRGGPVRQRFSGEVVEATVSGEKTVLLKPMRFMNCSGSSVAEAIGFYKLSPQADLIVLVDDYALPLGTIRVRGEGSSGGHNGLTDIERALGHTNYPRLRIGIDPIPATYDDPANWVLGRFTDEQFKALGPALDKAADAVDVFITQGVTPAMNKFNVKPKPTTASSTPTTPAATTTPKPH